MLSLDDVTRNPVLQRELLERAGSKRAAVAVSLWLILLTGLAILVYYIYDNINQFEAVPTDPAQIGKDLFEWTLFGMLGLVLFLVPAFTASAVAGERTRQTLIPVQMTTLSPLAIVLGKSLAAIAFTVLLVVIAAPILAVAFLIGGVGLGDIVKGLGMLLLTAVMLGTVGIMFSAVFTKVQGAIVMTYGFVLTIAVGSFVLLGVMYGLLSATSDFNQPTAPPKEILAVNPFVGLADFTAGSDVGFGNNPLTGLRVSIEGIEDEGFFGNGPAESTAVWRWYVVFCVLMIYSSLYIATNRLRTPAETER
jgi:ABC-type transport system involved in multi-copper enzyme maturation permease subunit